MLLYNFLGINNKLLVSKLLYLNTDVEEVRNEVCVTLELTIFGINCDGTGGNIFFKTSNKIPDGYKICGYDCWWTNTDNIILNVLNYNGYVSVVVANGAKLDQSINIYSGIVFLKKV